MTTLEIVLFAVCYVVVTAFLAFLVGCGNGVGRAFGHAESAIWPVFFWPVLLLVGAVMGAGVGLAWVLTRRGPLHGLHHRWFQYSCTDEPVHRYTRHGRLPMRVTFWPCSVCGAGLQASTHEETLDRVLPYYEGVGEPQLRAG